MLIINGKVLTMAGTCYDSACILVEGKKIIQIAEVIDRQENKDGIVVDVKGAWVLPGLIDAHSHIGISEEKTGFVGNNSNETTNPITPHIKALDAINPMDSAFHTAIKCGITSVMVGPGSSNVVGGQFAFMKTHGRCVDDMIVLEPAAMKIAFGENPKTNYGDKNMMPSSKMSIGAMLRETLFAAKQYADDKRRAKEKDEFFKEDFRKECWLPVLERKIPLKAHVHRADDILTAIRIAKLFQLDLTLDHCSEGHLIAEEIRESGYPAIVGPILATRNKVELRYVDLKTAGILNQAGIKVAMTTDHPVLSIECLPLCVGLAVKEGLDIEEGLKAITINAAEICRVQSRVGSIEVGKDADIAIFDGNPMEIVTTCLYTIIDGQIVYQYERDNNSHSNRGQACGGLTSRENG